MNDVDIGQTEWNNYLKKYKDVYQLKCDEIGIWSIRLNKGLGFIQPYSIVKQQLVAVLDFRSPKQLTYFKKSIIRMRDNSLKTSQNGLQDISIVFNEKNINRYDKLFSIRHKRKINKKELERMKNLYKKR